MNQQCFQVGDFSLDPTNRLLKLGDVPVSLSPKAFDALLYLAQNPGRLLTREELLQALWPDSFVEEGNLSVHIFQVRKALGAAADGKAYIQTVPKKGYRFNAVVKVLDQPENGLPREASGAPEVLPVIPPLSQQEIDGTDLPSRADAVRKSTATRSYPVGRHKWKLIAGVAVCLVAVVLVAERFLFTRQGPRSLGSPLRLTSFSPELSVLAAAISPDGKTLAYANPVGIFLEDIATRKTRPLQAPAGGLAISHLSWFADGSKLLATGVESDALTSSVWILQVKNPGHSIASTHFSGPSKRPITRSLR